MPRSCAADKETVISVLRRYIVNGHFQRTLPEWKSHVWDDLAKDLNYVWKVPALKLAMQRDWANVLSEARRLENILIYENVEETHPRSTDTSLNDSNHLDVGFRRDDDDDDDFTMPQERKRAEDQLFVVIFTSEIWKKYFIEKKQLNNNGCEETVLEPSWTDGLSDAIYSQHSLPCAWSFKRAKIYKSEGRTYYITIAGKCKSSKCGNSFFGFLEKEPEEGADVILKYYAKDTLRTEHEDVKRQLKGSRRQTVADSVIAIGAMNTRKEMALNMMKPGDSVCPIIPKKGTLRQAKNEKLGAKYGTDNPPDISEAGIIASMTQGQYSSCVVHVSEVPFFTFYNVPVQLQFYREFSRVHKGKVKLEIDATGSLMRSISRENSNIRSGHIFLFSIVINYKNEIIAVNQMITESHTNELITYFLQQWFNRNDLRKPDEFVMDYSKALILATCFSCNSMHISMYLKVCFQYLITNRKDSLFALRTYIRVDVAHLIHAVCRWHSITSVRHSGIKDFYVRCVSLLIECRNFQQFQHILLRIFVVSFHPYYSAESSFINEDGNPQNVPSTQQAQKFLEESISVRPVSEFEWTAPTAVADNDGKKEEEKRREEWADEWATDDIIKQWVQQLKVQATVASNEISGAINGLYNVEYGKDVMRICVEFPLWSAVMNNYFNCNNHHASSANVEKHFDILKTKLKALFGKPPRPSRFLKFHIEDIKGESLIAGGNLNQEKLTLRGNQTMVTI